MFHFPEPLPLSLYIHIPWCLRKCPYCDFNSHEARGAVPEADYIHALLADLEQDLPAAAERPLESLFLGGGTPSLLSPEAVERLLQGVRARLPLVAEAEITLEANPGTAEAGKFAEFRAAGITRLSIGVQSFNPEALQRLGRIHGRREAIAAAEMAHAAGFDDFNLDLMYGLPAQTPAQALADLRIALDLEPGHISHYQLTLEPNTLFHRYPPALPEEDTLWEMQERCQAALEARGYRHYEVSAYARAGRACRHNLNYWQFGDYLGIGAGAHAKLTNTQEGLITRTWKVKQPRDYLAKAASAARIGGVNCLSPADAGFEFMMNALRLIEGVPETLFSARTGLPLTAVERPLQVALERGLLERADAYLRPTETGQRFLNDLLGLFLEEDAVGDPDGRR